MVITVSRILHGIAGAPSPHRTASGRTPEDEISRDWYRHRYQWSVRYFLDHDIPLAWGSQTHRTPHDNDCFAAAEDETEPPVELVKRRILQDLIVNAEYAPQVRHFAPESLAFSFIADFYSSLGYRFLRELLPLSFEVTIRTRYRQSVSQIQEDLADRTKIQKNSHQLHHTISSVPRLLGLHNLYRCLHCRSKSTEE
jgi:hypothetical protein